MDIEAQIANEKWTALWSKIQLKLVYAKIGILIKTSA